MLSFFQVQNAKWDTKEGWNGNTLSFLSTREDPRINIENKNIVKTSNATSTMPKCGIYNYKTSHKCHLRLVVTT